MTNQGLSKLSLFVLDRITDVYPPFSRQIFQKIFLNIWGSDKSYYNYLKKFRKQLSKTKHFNKILIVVDINIGDAILLQSCAESIRQYFPGSQIDYLCNYLGGRLLSGLPHVNNVYNVVKGGGIPSADDLDRVEEVITENNYDLILNLSPFVMKKSLQHGGNVIQLYVLLTAYIMKLWRRNENRMHISYLTRTFFDDFLNPSNDNISKNIFDIFEKPSSTKYGGNVVYLPHNAVQEANEFLKKNNIYPMDRIVLFNPDATVKFSMIPFGIQIQVLKNLLESDDIDYVLISKAYSNPGIEKNILISLASELNRKIIIVPHMPLMTFTALIDLCNVFLTGDTGPLHIAASWKEPLDNNDHLRNSTAVISVIGATDSRMFCYDSSKPGHVPANQFAPSKVFIGEAPCRNITCLNKTGKTCNEVRCFNNIDPDKISSYIISYLQTLTTSFRKIG